MYQILKEIDKQKEGILTAEQIGNELTAFIKDTFMVHPHFTTEDEDHPSNE